MKSRLLILALAAVACAQGYTYSYDATPPKDYLLNHNGGTGNWGSTMASFFGNGSVIYGPAIGNDYEIKTRLSIQAGGGTFVHYLRASSDALYSLVPTGCNGSFYAIELTAPFGIGYYTNPWPGTLTIRRCVNGTLSTVAAMSLPVWDGTTFRSVVWGTTLWVYVDEHLVLQQTLASTTGQPGFGGWSQSPGGGFLSASIGPHDVYAPQTIAATGIRSSAFPTSVSLDWQGAPDDTGNADGGIGVYGYNITRNGTSLGMVSGASYTDSTVSASTAYTYTIAAVDYHGNVGTPASVTVTTPAAAAVDPRRTGVLTTGTYWGGGGEQIDMLSGNLNFSLPLVKAHGRLGRIIPVGLVYNSQNWRHDSNGDWQLGEDTGYGFGWTAQIGSITPYYKPWPNGVDHYIFTDASGSQYRLDPETAGSHIWSSTQGIYVWFDDTINELHFKDGSYWHMGSTSAGQEQDAGTMYPTLIEDISGNEVIVTYQGAASLAASTNSSARITRIEDVRAQSCGAGCRSTYTFSYNNNPIPHLSSVTNSIGTAENYTFTYASASLAPPFGSNSAYAGLTTTHLAALSVAGIGAYLMTYDSMGAGELTQVKFPWGGHLRWDYGTAVYATSGSLREVTSRYLAADSAGAVEWTYPITHSDAGTTISGVHADATLADPSGVGSKTWAFLTSGSAWQIGLLAQFMQTTSVSGSALTQDTYTWSQSSTGNPYISAKTSVPDGITAQSLQTTKTIDGYGNVTQVSIYPYDNTTTPLRTYTSTYLGGSYLTRYIRDRLLQTTLTFGGTTKTLVRNYYDGTVQTGQSTPTFTCPVSWIGTSQTGGAVESDPYEAWIAIGYLTETELPGKSVCSVIDRLGNVTSTSGSDGITNNVAYSANFTAPSLLSSPTYSESLSYNSWLGITQTGGSNGEQMYMTYDSYGRPSTAISAYWTSGHPYVTYSYSGFGTIPALQEETGPNGHTRTTLDGLGRAMQVDRGPGSYASSTKTVYAPCACSPLAKLQKTSQPYTSGGSPTAWTEYTYDGIGRTLSVTQPDGVSTTTYAYSGNQTTVTDPAGNWKKFTTDELGNLVKVEEPDPASSTGGSLFTYYSYDWMNHLACVDMTRGGTLVAEYTYSSNGVTCRTGYTGGARQTRTFVYDDNGRLTSATNPENGTISYIYNTTGTLKNKTDAKGQVTAYTYDSSNRLTKVQAYPTGLTHAEDTCEQVVYTYGTDSASYNYGRLLTKAYGSWTGPYYDSAGNQGTCVPGRSATKYTESYTYHPAGAVTKKELKVSRHDPDGSGGFNNNSGTLSVNYTYDSWGRLSTTSNSAFTTWAGPGVPVYVPVTLTYGYDSMGRPATLKDNVGDYYDSLGNKTWVHNVQYDLAGRMTSMQRYRNLTSKDCLNDDLVRRELTESMTWNVNGQMMGRNFSWSQWDCNVYSSQNAGIQYAYTSTGHPNNNGQVIAATDGLSGETITYVYDALKRLVSASSAPTVGSTPAAWTENYGYDGFGNLTSKVLNGGTNAIPAIDAATNRFTSGYDLNGNMLTGFGLTMTYDENNRVASASTGSGTKYYSYAPDNKRIYRSDERWTFYGAFGEKIGDFVGWSASCSGYGCNLAPVTYDIWFAGKLVWEGQPGSWSPFAPMEDRVGTNRANGARFRPYGDEITTTTDDHEKFGTYERNGYTKLDYADQRYYASGYGRFTTVDRLAGTLKDPGSLNKYSYVRGDPLNRNDPRGLCDAVIGGITESSSSNSVSQFASSIGAMQAFPYAGTDIGTGVNAVLNTSANQTIEAKTAAAAINAAAADSAGPINIFAFSGGAAAFTSAIPLLSSGVIARIHSITYASPGIAGTLGTVNGITPTVILGQGVPDVAAGLGTAIPSGWNIVDTACGHDADCEFQAAHSEKSAGSACNQTSTFSAHGLTTFGALMNLSNEYLTALGNSAMALIYPPNLVGFAPYDPFDLLPSPPPIEDVTSAITYEPIVP